MSPSAHISQQQPETVAEPAPALHRFWQNIRQLPHTVKESTFRAGKPVTHRARSLFVFGNVFLHLHSTRVHRWSLRARTTLGLGFISLSAFLLTLVTGVLLMFYYKPYPGVAYDSIKDIHFVVPTGRFIRNIHRWAANVMVVAVIAHLARVFYTAAYRKPREFNWLVGMVLFVLTLALAFTGYLLPWDQLAYWAITIGSNIAQSPREVTDALNITSYFDIGGFQKVLLLGSDTVGEEALIRFYVLHIMVLPLVLCLFLAVHFWRIRKDGGLARPADVEKRLGNDTFGSMPVFDQMKHKTYQLVALVKGKMKGGQGIPEHTVPSMPHLFYAEMAVLMLTTLICLGLSLWIDAPLKELANPAVPENPAKAPWYFLGLQEIIAFSAFMGGIGIPMVALLGLSLIPFLDREKQGTGLWFGGPGGGPLVLWSVFFALGVTIGVEAVAIHFGWLREWFPDIPQLVITLCNPGTVLAAMYALYSLYVMKRYNSTRAGAIGLFTCFIIGFIIMTLIGSHFRGPNWEFYWSPSQWPGH